MEHGNTQGRYDAQVLGYTSSMRRPGVCLALAIAIAAVAPVMFGPGVLSARAATSTIVSLNFDNNTASEFTLGYQQALQPHAVPATFYVNSGTVATGTSTTKISWAQLGTLACAVFGSAMIS